MNHNNQRMRALSLRGALMAAGVGALIARMLAPITAPIFARMLGWM